MRKTICTLVLLLGIGSAGAATPPSAALPPPPPGHGLDYGALDQAKIAIEDDLAARTDQPLRYAIGHPVKTVSVSAKASAGGYWTRLPDGRQLWQLPIHAEGATNVDIGFSRWFLPHGAEIWFSDAKRSVVYGPYTDADNPRTGGLSLPMVPGADALLELIVAADKRTQVDLQLSYVSHGYRNLDGIGADKSGSCNVDTICPQGDAWRDQIRSVGRYTFSGAGMAGFLCSGQLVNRSNGDRQPLLLTANHCLSSQAEASTVVVYWKYESPSCRTIDSGANGTSLPISTAAATQSGATLLASYSPSDMTLLRLNTAPPAAADAYWSGWDRRDLAPQSGTAIHHPQGHEKRISFENDPLTITDYLPSPRGDSTTHLRVFDWDLGTTEGGSSGSGLWNAEKRLVGTLHGGFAACGNAESDYYGRLYKSWAGGGTTATRLSDHLDPIATARETLDGTGLCDAPSVTLTQAPDPAIAGTDLVYTAVATGGSGNYTYIWDIDGDGVDDATTTTNSMSARFNREAVFTARVVVRDSAGCEASKYMAVSVASHRVRPTAALNAPVEVCGDGDAVIEPGERWRLDSTLLNAGARATTAQAVSAFTKSSADSVAGAPRDGFGYAVTDSTQGGQCGYQFIDITNQVAPLQLTQAGAVSANDDGRTGVLDLAAVNGSFNFYGRTVSQVVMSTNGYIGTTPGTTGGDFSNTCGPLPSADNNGSRLQVLHDDLVSGSLRWASFAQCPRPSETGNANQRCLVFQWNNVGLYTGSGQTPTGDFDFQAVVYPLTWQIVYQYRNSIPGNGDSATVGILDPDTSGYQLTASCDQAQVTPLRAVCFYHPQNLPASTADLSKLRLENALVNLGVMQPDATRSVSTFFAVDPTASCGSRYRIGLAGTADEMSGNYQVSTREFLIGAEGNCDVSNSCAVSLPPTINLRPGAFFNPLRPGNGLVSHVVPISGELPVFFAAWYTGARNRQPTWYIVQGRLQDNQVVAPILRVTRDTAAATFSVSRVIVGTARIQFVSPEKMLFSYLIDSPFEAGTELLVHGFQGLSSATPNRTGAWYYAQEDGWGQTYDSYVAAGIAREFITSYVYDANGEPRWVLTDAPADAAGDLPTKAFKVHCPSCGWIDFFASETAAGTMRRSFVAPNAADLSTNFSFIPPLPGSWVRSDIPISLLTPVQPQQP